MRIAAILTACALVFGPVPATAQNEQTLADIRQELTVLHVEIQRLKREMSTTGSPTVNLSGTSVLDRVAAIEEELQRLTAQTEQLGNRIDRVVADGTNRIGDLEFRLVELEGGDVSKLGETSTLGGGAASVPAVSAPGAPDAPQTELAMGEQADFEAGVAALAAQDYANAATLFQQFNQNYPGSPLSARAELSRGRALDGLGDTREAARAYLASFTADPTGADAAEALFELGASLGRLQQVDQACVTLSEVGARFPGSQSEAKASKEMVALGCG